MPQTRYRHSRTKRLILLLSAAAFLCVSAEAASKTTLLQARVTEILIKFPAGNAADKNALAAALLSLGSDGIQEVCRRLAPPGAADDSLARYALDAAAVYASRAGAEKDRREFIDAIIDSLDEVRYSEIKAFLISELQLAGKDESVKTLGRYLEDLRLCEPAARALQSIQTARAEKVLLNALEDDNVANPMAIIMALGELRSLAAVKRISVYAGSGDEKARQAALFALANIGDPASQNILSRIPLAASPFERTAAASRYLLYAQRLAESGRREQAFKICRDLIRNFTAPGESQVRAAALTLLSGIVGNSFLVDLLQAVESPDPIYRQRALELAESIRGEQETALWIEKTSKVPPEIQADIIEMLGRRGDKTALPLIRGKLRSEEKAIRMAAIPAVARLETNGLFDELIPLLLKGEDDEVEVVKQALLSLPSDGLVPRAAGAMVEAPPSARVALIEILGERKAKDYADVVLAMAKNEDEDVRQAALIALEQVVRDRNLFQVIELLLASTNGSDIAALQNAIVAAANQILDPENRADPVISAILKASGSRRVNLLRTLARIGGARALQLVIADTKNADPQVRSVAIYTLSNWPDPAAMEELFNIARTAIDRKFRYLALQGIVRLGHASAKTADKKLSLLNDALEMAKEPEEKNLVIAGLSNVKSQESLAAAAKFLDDSKFQTRAAQAVAKIALPASGGEGLSGFDVIFTLKKAALFIENELDRENLEDYINDLLIKEGFSPLFNRKTLAGWKGLVGDPPGRARMSPKKLAEEQKKADDDMRLHWKVIDGGLVFDGKGHSLCTAKDYSDFEMFVDWKIEEKGDSGIYLRGSPQVQIWDPAQWPEGSGGLYNNKIGPAKPLVPADRPIGEWNTFYIKMIGDRVTVYLNGVLVVDDVAMENYWERDKPIYRAGQIELQAHSTPLYFRNISIREIAPGTK